jgi:hypothetical protein
MPMKLILLAISSFILFSCKKDASKTTVSGTVQQQEGCLPDSWLVAIDNPNSDKYSFICKTFMPPSASLNCTNSIYIVNLPASMKQPGKKISFSGWNEQASCLSSRLAPRQVEALNIKEQ